MTVRAVPRDARPARFTRLLPGAVSWRLAAAGADAGMTTAEYAVGTVAACGFAGVLYRVISSPEVFAAVKRMILHALQLAF